MGKFTEKFPTYQTGLVGLTVDMFRNSQVLYEMNNVANAS